MPDEKLNKITLRYNGLFDFDGMYAAVTDWAKNYGYMWHEVDYKHKVPSPAGAEQEMTWLMTKNITEYVRFEILLIVHIWDLTEVQVERNDKQVSLSNARLYILMNGTVKFDYGGIGKGGKFTKWLGEKYYKYTSKNLSGYLDQLYYRMWNLHAILKKYFDMQTKKYEYKGYLGEK